MLNRTGLVPPYSGNAGDGFASPPEPEESLADELAKAESAVYAWALKDAIHYLVQNAVDNAGIDVRAAINIRHNMRFTDVDRIVAKAKTFLGPAVEREKRERAKMADEKSYFDNLSSLFTALGLEVHKTDGKYTVSGLTEQQAQMCAEALSTESAE